MAMYIVQAKEPIKAGTGGVYDMVCMPLKEDVPPGRRVRMDMEDAIAAALLGKVKMLSPDGVREVEKRRESGDIPKPKRGRPTYKTRVEKPED